MDDTDFLGRRLISLSVLVRFVALGAHRCHEFGRDAHGVCAARALREAVALRERACQRAEVIVGADVERNSSVYSRSGSIGEIESSSSPAVATQAARPTPSPSLPLECQSIVHRAPIDHRCFNQLSTEPQFD